MPWQANEETGRIVRLAYADEGTSPPSTLPNTGSSLDWSADASGENCHGWTANDFKLTDDDFSFEDAEGAPITVKPPTNAKKSAIIRDVPNTPERVVFTSFEVGAKVLSWCTNVSETSGEYTKSADHTRKALIIEVGGLGIHYFPSVEIESGSFGGGAKTLAVQQVTAEVFKHTSLESGWKWIQYQDA